MAQYIYAIVADEVRQTGKVSFRFMVDSKAPYQDFIDIANVFGLLLLEEKNSNYVNPFRLARGEPGAIGSDGYRRWNLNVFRSGEGFLACVGVDEDKADEAGLQKALSGDIPDVVLLTHVEALEGLQKACMVAGITLEVHRFHGTLATS